MAKIEQLLKGKIPGPETGIEVKKSICTICDPTTQCGVDLFVKDGKIIKVEGSDDHPYNKGALCVKGAAIRQYVHNEKRIKTPLKRVGERGSGKFEPISWDEALDTIAEKFNEIKTECGPESVAFFSGYAKYFRPYLKRLAYKFGSPNYITESSTCYQATTMAMKLVFGERGNPDIANTNCLLIWSSNPLYTKPLNSRGLRKALGRGMKLIVVDPRQTPTTAHADIHLQLRPGTDGALALAMANEIIKNNLYDQEFVSNHAYGFNEYKEYVAEFTAEVGEKLTGVPADKIREAARMFACIKPACVMSSSSSLAHCTNGVQNYRAVFMLVGLTGNFDVKGGNIVMPGSFIHTPGLITTREKEFTEPRQLSEMAPRIGSNLFPVWEDVIEEEAQCVRLPLQISTGEPYPIKGLLGMGLNYRMWPDSAGMLEGLKNLDFFVNVDLFMTDTCKYAADIVLPACSSAERSELRCYGMGYIIFTQPAISPLYDSRSDVDIIYELANRLGLDDPLFKAGYEASVDWILEPSGITVEELKKHPAGMFVPNPIRLPEKKYLDGGFKTLSGKLEFKSKIIEKHSDKPGFEALPVYAPPKYSPEGSPELAEEYPFILNTGSRLPMYVHTRVNHLSWINSLRPNDPAADLNPEDAARLGIKQYDMIKVSTEKGSIQLKANLTQMAQPGVVHIYHGKAEADVNLLFEGDYVDPLSGFPGFKSALCKIEKIKEGK